MGLQDLPEVRGHLAWWQPILGLRDWVFSVDTGKLDPEVYAKVVATPARHLATITLNEGTTLVAPDTLEMIVVHEMVHVVQATAIQFAEDQFGEGSPASKTLGYLMEPVADTLTQALLRAYRCRP